jgi:hypothetical protein
MRTATNRARRRTKGPSDEATVRAAHRMFHDEGTIEVDDNATVSRADGNLDRGAYVQAWVWVSDDEAGE